MNLFYSLFALTASSGQYEASYTVIDEQLISEIADNNREALRAFYSATKKSLYSYVLSLCKEPESARDIMQETYLKVRACAHLYQPQGKPLAWLFTIAKNLFLMQLRKEKRAQPVAFQEIENSLSFSYETDAEDRLVLQEALKILKEEELQILLLHVVSGMKHHEIGDNLGLGTSTVLSKYHRALKKLRKHLESKGVSVS